MVEHVQARADGQDAQPHRAAPRHRRRGENAGRPGEVRFAQPPPVFLDVADAPVRREAVAEAHEVQQGGAGRRHHRRAARALRGPGLAHARDGGVGGGVRARARRARPVAQRAGV